MPNNMNLGPITTSFYDGPPIEAVQDIATRLGDVVMDRPWYKLHGTSCPSCHTVFPQPDTRGSSIDSEMQWFDYIRCVGCNRLYWRKSNYTIGSGE